MCILPENNNQQEGLTTPVHGNKTHTIIELIKHGMNYDQIQQEIEKRQWSFPTIRDVLNTLIGQKDQSVRNISDVSGISQTTIYRIMNGTRNATRNMIIRIASAMALDIEETQILLKSANCALLGSRERDIIIMHGLENKLFCDQINDELKAHNMAPLNIPKEDEKE